MQNITEANFLSQEIEKLYGAGHKLKFALDALGGVEADFECSNMCGIPYLYTFSDVSKGIPIQNCHNALLKFVNWRKITFTVGFWILFVLTMICTIFMFRMWKHDYTELVDV